MMRPPDGFRSDVTSSNVGYRGLLPKGNAQRKRDLGPPTRRLRQILEIKAWGGTLPLEEVSTARGSGWVDDQYAKLLMILNPNGQPTRHRGVVLTVSKRELGR